MKKPATALPEAIIDHLQGKSIVLLNAIEPESQQIYSTAISWVYAADANTIHFAVDSKSKLIEMFEQNPKVSLTVIADESTYAIAGQVALKVSKAEEVSINLALLEITVQEVRDIMFFGGKITTEPAYVKTYDAKLIEKLDREVLAAVQKIR